MHLDRTSNIFRVWKMSIDEFYALQKPELSLLWLYGYVNCLVRRHILFPEGKDSNVKYVETLYFLARSSSPQLYSLCLPESVSTKFVSLFQLFFVVVSPNRESSFFFLGGINHSVSPLKPYSTISYVIPIARSVNKDSNFSVKVTVLLLLSSCLALQLLQRQVFS